MNASTAEPGVASSEFIFERSDFAECHASTIAQSGTNLIAAWFGGKKEGANDVEIWVSRNVDGKWTAPKSVANGISDGKRYPTWNPVLFQPKGKDLILFYKVGPSPSEWWGMQMRSSDDGVSWGNTESLPKNILGPIKNKPVQLADGTILCGSSTEHDGWQVHFERSPDAGKTWQTVTVPEQKGFGVIQPTLLVHLDGAIQALCRSKQGKVVETWSKDGGRTWSGLKATSLPNPNSGIDAVTLKNGRHVLIYNHTGRGRSPINVAVSENGKDWQAAAVLESEPGEYSYPAVIEGNDGRIHVTYTWKRKKIKHVVLNASELRLRPMIDGAWPKAVE